MYRGPGHSVGWRHPRLREMCVAAAASLTQWLLQRGQRGGRHVAVAGSMPLQHLDLSAVMLDRQRSLQLSFSQISFVYQMFQVAVRRRLHSCRHLDMASAALHSTHGCDHVLPGTG